ncbi:MAG: NlpC/P60 family protein [Alphaproteobacteria bacterium]
MKCEQKIFLKVTSIFLTVVFGILFLNVQKAYAQCGFNSIGDYVCDQPTGNTDSGSSMGGGPRNFIDNILPNVESTSGCSSISQVGVVLSALPVALQNAMIAQLVNLFSSISTNNCDRIDDLIGRMLIFHSLMSDLPSDPCGVSSDQADGGILNLDGAFQAAVFNLTAIQITWSTSQPEETMDNIVQDVCSSPEMSGGGAVGTPPDVDPLGKWCPDARAAAYATDPTLPGTYNITATDNPSRVAESAAFSVGATTADMSVTNNGRLGCALAVSRILACAGLPVGIHTMTTDLDRALRNDPCWTAIGQGRHHDVSELQPGDVLMTPTVFRNGQRVATGHTGIYVGNDQIIENSSSQGAVASWRNVATWNQQVANRNVAGTVAWRNIC